MTLKELRQIVKATENLPEDTRFRLITPNDEGEEIEYKIDLDMLEVMYIRLTDSGVTPNGVIIRADLNRL